MFDNAWDWLNQPISSSVSMPVWVIVALVAVLVIVVVLAYRDSNRPDVGE